MSICRALIVSASIAVEGLGQIFRLLYICCKKSAQWIQNLSQDEEVKKTEPKETAGVDCDSRASIRSQEMPSLSSGAMVLVTNTPSEPEIQFSDNAREVSMPLLHRRRYYVVAVGRRPGIYNTWADANREVSGFPGNCHQAFRTHQEAEYFLSQYRL